MKNAPRQWFITLAGMLFMLPALPVVGSVAAADGGAPVTVLPVVTAQDIDAQLAKAQALKSQDPTAFAALLDSLASVQNAFSAEQRFRYTYLNGYRLGFSGDPEGAIAQYNQVIEGTRDSTLRVEATTALLNIYALTRNYTEGYLVAARLAALLTTVSNEPYAHALIGSAIFYNQAVDYNNALDAANRALIATTSPRLACFARNLIVEARFHLNEIGNGDVFDAAIDACEEANEPVATLLTRIFQARYLNAEGRNDEALAVLQQEAPLLASLSYPRAEADFSAALASVYLSRGQVSEAGEAAQTTIRLSAEMGATQPRVEAFEVLYQVYEQQGNSEQAFAAYKQFAQLEKAYLDASLVTQLAALRAKNNVQAKESQIAILDKQNSLLRTQSQLDKEELQNSRLLIAVLLLLGVIVVGWVLINRRMHNELRIQAQTDKLTGIANRHYFTSVAESTLAHHQKTDQPLAFVIFDLDLFKSINDNHGHLVGDWALKAVVDAIRSVCRQQDVIGRMGGEEFALLLPGCTIGKAHTLADNCRQAIAAIDTLPSGACFTITASFGVTDTAQCGYVFDELYAKADMALYRSKEEGRNKVFCYSPSIEPGESPGFSRQPAL
ncbi:sensor domain-containing diguanylate cyclase [Alteromonas sp. CYL-A6]|uniref:sensor domain-containing diguanylate cyclase n=1 Tax=Alteromonas nitratireducens TaxID=3390813 RepID=UPI0034AE2C85